MTQQKSDVGVLSVFRTMVAPLHREGWKFVGGSLAAAVVLFLAWPPLGWLGLLVSGAVAFFFRDPKRVCPLREGLILAPSDGIVSSLREGLILAPADGIVSSIDEVEPLGEFGWGTAKRTRVSIFLSVFDVHVNRSPVSGLVRCAIYTRGQFLNAASKESERNERRALVIEMPNGADIAVVQIAGLIARRIVGTAKEGDRLVAGQRIGLIRFGSRTDTYLPLGAIPMVAVGQRMVGGETVLADLQSCESVRNMRTD
jgi:phosphatidylserine decarboxylase